MLQTEVMEATVGISQELTDKGLRLEPKGGPLALLVSEFATAAQVVGASVDDDKLEDEAGYIIGILADSSRSLHRVEDEAVLDASNHDKRTEEFAELIKTGVLASVANAKTCIGVIKDIEADIQAAMDTYEARDLANVSIDEVGIDPVIDNEAVISAFEEYQNVIPGDVGQVAVFPHQEDVAALLKHINTGDADLDAYLQHTAMLTTLTSGETPLISHVYSLVFLSTGDSSHLKFSDLSYNMGAIADLYGSDLKLAAWLLVYYLAKGFVEDMPEGVNSGVTAITGALTRLYKFAGSHVYSTIKKSREAYTRKELFPLGLPHVNKATGSVNPRYNIRVNKDLYARFLADGGTPEVIYGTMVGDRNTEMAHLLENKEKYEAAYAKFVSLNRSYTTTSQVQLYSKAINDAMYKAAEQLEISGSTGIFLRLRDYLKRMGGDVVRDPSNTYVFIRSLVCNCIYPNNPEIEAIISNIDSYEPEDGVNLNVSEIANLVLVDLIVDWLVDQVAVRKI